MGDRLADEAEQRPVAAAVVARDDHRGLVVGALGDGQEGAHALLGHPVAAVDLDLDARDLTRALAQGGGREVVGRRVLQLAREVLRVGPDGAAVHRVGDVVVGGDDHLVELARRLVLGARAR